MQNAFLPAMSLVCRREGAKAARRAYHLNVVADDDATTMSAGRRGSVIIAAESICRPRHGLVISDGEREREF